VRTWALAVAYGSNNKGASVGEGFSILRMPAIVREGRTLQVENS